MFQQYQAVPAYVITSNLMDFSDADLSLVKKGVEDQIIEEAPGIAILNPGHVYQEMIAFKDVATLPWNDSILLLGVTRGVYGGAFHHPSGTEVYIDQGEQYLKLTENSQKEMLKRCLRTLKLPIIY